MLPTPVFSEFTDISSLLNVCAYLLTPLKTLTKLYNYYWCINKWDLHGCTKASWRETEKCVTCSGL